MTTPFEKMMAHARYAVDHMDEPLRGESEGVCEVCGKEHKTIGDLVECAYHPKRHAVTVYVDRAFARTGHER